jgi:hypothetical protein
MFATPFFTFYWDSEIVAHLAVHDAKNNSPQQVTQ